MWWWVFFGAAFLLEPFRLAVLSRLPAHPDFLLGMVVLAALKRRPPGGAAAGLALGLFRDIIYRNPLGLEAVPLTLIGWGVGSLGRSIYREAMLTQVMMMLGGGLLHGILVYLLMTGGDPAGLPGYVLRIALPGAALTALVVPFAFHFLARPRRRAARSHEKKIRSERQRPE